MQGATAATRLSVTAARAQIIATDLRVYGVSTITKGDAVVKEQEYKKLTARLCIGRSVRARRDLSNGNIRIPIGAVLRIRGKSNGFSLEGPKCPHCGVAPYITRVRANDVDLEPLLET